MTAAERTVARQLARDLERAAALLVLAAEADTPAEDAAACLSGAADAVSILAPQVRDLDR